MKQLDYKNGNITRTILASALPMLVAQAVNLLYSMIDRVYIGHIDDANSEALGALGLAFPAIIVITAFTNLFSGGGAPLFAIARGQKKPKRAFAILQQCFFLEIGTAIVLMTIGLLFAGPLLRLFGATDVAMPYCLPYLRIYLIGTIFSMVSTGMSPFIVAQGYPTYGMITVSVGAVLNLILDPIFIFPMGLGISGAALATVISQGVSAMIVCCVLFSKRMPIPLVMKWIRQKNDSAEKPISRMRLTFQILTLGLASFVMGFTNALVGIVCNSVLARTGGHVYISVMTVISSLRQVFETPLLAICDGSAPVVSFNYGAGAYDRVRRSVKTMTLLSLAYTVVIWILIMVFPTIFISIFIHDESTLALTIPTTRIYFCAFLFMTLQYVGQTSYKALNQRARSIFFSILRKVILVIPLTYLLPLILDPSVNGVFAAEPISNVIGGSASFFTMLFFIRKLKND